VFGIFKCEAGDRRSGWEYVDAAWLYFFFGLLDAADLKFD
jgi:hypothetical protein